jgi:hypothetical protein
MAAPGTASYKRLYRRVAAALNALDRTTYTSATPTINDRRRVEGMIRDAIVAKDAAVRAAICMTEKSPHRVRYMSYTTELSDGDQIPDHYGPIGEVVIKKYSGGSFEPAVEADTVDQINDWRENAGGVYGAIAHDAAGSPLAGYFKLVGTRIRITGYRVKLEIATFDISGEAVNPPVLGSPDAFEDVIFAGSVGDSPMEGDDFSQTGYLRDYYAQTMPMILAGTYEVPPLQQK